MCPFLLGFLLDHQQTFATSFLQVGSGLQKRGVFKRLMAFQMGVGNVFMAK
jgi:hypothetical protein